MGPSIEDSNIAFIQPYVSKNRVGYVSFARVFFFLSNYDSDGNENVKRQRVSSAKQQLCTWITLFCKFICRLCTTTTWNDHILSLLGNDKAINSTISVWNRARSLLFSSDLNSLLLRNWTTWDDGKKSERMLSLFFRDVFMNVAVVGS